MHDLKRPPAAATVRPQDHPRRLLHQVLVRNAFAFVAYAVRDHIAFVQFEDYLTRQGTVILKFFLNVSRKEQKKRFLERLDDPDKRWKFSDADIRERKYWDDYMHAYEEAIRATASKHAPWFVAPADNKWFTRLVVAAAIVEALERLDLEYPMVDSRKEKELIAVRAALLRQKAGAG